MSEVQVEVGANITPFKQKMAQVKASAKETAESFGLEFDRGAARAESRVSRGVSNMVRQISSAQDPIQAVGALVEGLGRSFAIASGAFLAVGIGAAIYEQFSKAEQASEKLKESIENLGKVDADNESIHQLQRDIDDFQKVEEQYNERGLLEKILFGGQEDQMFHEAESLNAIKKNLIDIKQLQAEDTKARARILIASDNPEDQKKGRLLEKSIGDDEEKGDLQDKLDQAEKAQAELQRRYDVAAATYAASREAALHSGRGAKSVQIAARAAQADLSASIASGQRHIDEIKKTLADLTKAQAAETDKAEEPEKKKDSTDRSDEEEQHAVREQLERRGELTTESADAGLTGDQKAAALKSKIAQEQKTASADAPLQRRSQQLAEQNHILKDQIELQRQIKENDKEAASRAERMTELQKERTSLLARVGDAKNEAHEAANAALGFHGQVSSLRKVGFGKAPTVNQNASQLKAAQEANKLLAKAVTELTDLNGKIGGVV